MNGYEFAFYSLCVIVGSSLLAWLWYLAAKSEPSNTKSKYEAFLPKKDWSITYYYDNKPKGDKK